MRNLTFPDREIVEIIKNIEDAYDVNSLQIDGINYWPLIRHEIRTQLLSQKPFAFTRTWSTCIRQLSNIFYRGAKILHGSLGFDNFLDTLSEDRTDCLFLSFDEDYRENVYNKKYSAEFDPLIERIPMPIKVRKIKFGYGNYIDTSYYTPVAIVNSQFFSFKYLLTKYRYKVKILKDLDLTDLNKVISEKSKNLVNINKNMLAEQIGELFVFRDLFLQIFQKIKPKILFMSTYYNRIWMGAILAAKILGIKTVDIQHGWQGDIHFMHSNWSKIPVRGYDLLPEYFWVWSSYFEQFYHAWIPEGSTAHKVVIGGQIWLQKWQNTSFQGLHKEEYRHFFESVSFYDKIILVTIEYADPPVLPHLVEAIKRSSGKWLWLIRLHPGLRCHYSDFSAFFKSQNVTNIEMENANAYPIYALLENIDHHVCYYSTVCFEASAFAKPTTFIYDIGLISFAEFINAGIFSYASSSDELIDSITNPKKEFDQARRILNMNSNQADIALGIIFKDAGISAGL